MDLLTWFLLALPLALDVFAVGLVFGLAGLERPRWLRVALGFALIGGALIGAGLLLGETLEGALGTTMLYVAGLLLLVIGVLAIRQGLHADGIAVPRPLNSRRIVATAIAVAVDKFAVGLSFAAFAAPVGATVTIVAVQTFAATILGIALGKRLGARAGDIAEIVAGLTFTGLGLVVLYQAFGGRG